MISCPQCGKIVEPVGSVELSIAKDPRVKRGAELLLKSMKMLPGAVVACNGLKCREPNCQDCYGEDAAHDYIGRIIDHYAEIQDFLATGR